MIKTEIVFQTGIRDFFSLHAGKFRNGVHPFRRGLRLHFTGFEVVYCLQEGGVIPGGVYFFFYFLLVEFLWFLYLFLDIFSRSLAASFILLTCFL